MSRFRVPLVWTAAGLFLGNTVFTAVVGVAWPGKPPPWTTRTTSAAFLLSALVAGAAALSSWLYYKGRR